MAKMAYLGASGVDRDIGDNFGNADGSFTTTGKTSATWTDAETGSSITFEGAKLKFELGVLVSGDVDKILFEDVEDADIAKFKGDFSAQKLGAALANDGVRDFIEHALRGNDVMTGTVRDDYIKGEKGNDTIRSGAGDDTIRGGEGNDRMFGGAGSDHFLFFLKTQNTPHDGHDSIMDFDANGGGIKQDYIAALWEDVRDIHRSGHDTVVDFDGGGSITLVDVKRSDVSQDDFITLI